MKKIALGILITVILTALAGSVAFALPALPTNRGIEKAKEVSPVITDKGLKAPPEFVADLPESELTKIVFIRYAPGREPTCDNDGICDSGENWKTCSDCTKGGEEPITACYAFLSGSKPKWNWVENYYYSDPSLLNPSVSAVSTWESIPNTRDIFGYGLEGANQWGIYDYKNSILYGDYDDTGLCPTEEPCVIAVTAFWVKGKNIYEYDIMFDTNFFPGTGEIDLDTVVLHEFGHAAGLNDLYNVTCANNVMYGYYTGVNTTLGNGDKTGIQKLYGL